MSLSEFTKNINKIIRNEGRTGYTFRGRDTELQRLYKLVTSSDYSSVILMYGLKQIGKSRLMLQLMKLFMQEPDYLCCYHNFRRERQPFLSRLKNALAPNDAVDEPVCRLFEDYVEKCDKVIVFFLDDVDKVDKDRTPNGNNELREFLKDVSENCEGARFILTSTDKMSFVGPYYEAFEVGPLDDESMTEIVFDVMKEAVDRGDQQVYVKAVAKLCEGLPVAAILMGNEIKDDDGLLEPCEILELLITNRIHALSPNYYPPSDRVGDLYSESYKSLDSMFKDMFDSLSDSMTGNQFLVKDAVQAVGLLDASDGLVKKQYIQPLVKRSILTVEGSGSNSKDRSLKLHNIFRDCIAAQKAKTEQKKHELLKLSQESAMSIGLNLSLSVLESPRSLATMIAGMRCPQDEGDSDDVYRRTANNDGAEATTKVGDKDDVSLTSVSGPRALSYISNMSSGSLHGNNGPSSQCREHRRSDCESCLGQKGATNNLSPVTLSQDSNASYTNNSQYLTTQMNVGPVCCENSMASNASNFAKHSTECIHCKGPLRVNSTSSGSSSSDFNNFSVPVTQIDLTNITCDSNMSTNSVVRSEIKEMNIEGCKQTDVSINEHSWIDSGVKYLNIEDETQQNENTHGNYCRHCDTLQVHEQHCDTLQVHEQHCDTLQVHEQHCDTLQVHEQHCDTLQVHEQHCDTLQVHEQHCDTLQVHEERANLEKGCLANSAECVNKEEGYIYEDYQVTTTKQTPELSGVTYSHGRNTASVCGVSVHVDRPYTEKLVCNDCDCAKDTEEHYVYSGYQVSTAKLAPCAPEMERSYRCKLPRHGDSSVQEVVSTHGNSHVQVTSGESEETSSQTEKKVITSLDNSNLEKEKQPSEHEYISTNLNTDKADKVLSDKDPFK